MTKYNIILYIPVQKYQANREEIITLIPNYDKTHKYLFFSLNKLAKIDCTKYNTLAELLCNINTNITNENINHVFFYPRQLKYLTAENHIHNLIINSTLKKSIYIDDIHMISINKEIIDKFDNKIMSYKYLSDKFLGKLKNTISFPHCLNDKFIYNNELKNIKISILGHTIADTYLLRKTIVNNLNDINNSLINCSIQHFAKQENNKYYEILRKSYASIATTGDNPKLYYPYIVSKYFEIPGSGGLLIAHILPEMEEEFKKYGFIENVNYIKFTNICDLIDKCNYIFDPLNKDKVENIRINGFNLVKSNHLMSNRINKLIEIFNNN